MSDQAGKAPKRKSAAGKTPTSKPTTDVIAGEKSGKSANGGTPLGQTADEWQRLIYAEAMQNLRATMASGVSAGTALVAGSLVLAGLAVELKTYWLMIIAAFPTLLLLLLFDKWAKLNETFMDAANKASPYQDDMAGELKRWIPVGEATVLQVLPLIATVVLFIAAIGIAQGWLGL